MKENTNKNSKLDIRIIQLSKWQIPKSDSIFEYSGGHTYLSIGYFDMIEVKSVQNNADKHPLTVAHQCLHRNRNSHSSENFLYHNYNIQELIVFTNIGENGFDSLVIENFWDRESHLMFVSLIHIDNESDIQNIVKKIKDIFSNVDYMYYFSFDYSGIVLFAKNISIDQYVTNMFALNYQKTDDKKLVRDSYSFYGFRKNGIKTYFEQFENKKYKDVMVPYEEEIAVTVNIGIQNFNIYEKFVDDLKKIRDVKFNEYCLLGRHDVSIVSENANIKWLIYVQYLLDKYTQKIDGRTEDDLFSTHETFVKIKLKKHFVDTTEKHTCDKLGDELHRLCNEFINDINRNMETYSGEYRVPVRAVEYSIMGIMKNRFAEDFVLCMYESFCAFLSYLTEQIHKFETIEDVKEFNRCFENYFKGLNSLVNSAMHSERQFIQITAFNAIIYDVPSKIMAFYVAFIHRVQKIIKSNTDKKYTFLLTPSFHNDIAVEIISYYPAKGETPMDRILMVKINEKSLYNPKTVMQRMTHEVAHFVGDDLRNREERKFGVKYFLVEILLNHLLHKVFIEEDEYEDLKGKLMNLLPVDKRFSIKKNNYSQSLCMMPYFILNEFNDNELIQDELNGHIQLIIAKYLLMRDAELNKKNEIKTVLKNMAALKMGSKNNVYTTFLEKEYCSKREVTILAKMVMEDIQCELNYLCMDRMFDYNVKQSSQSAISRIGRGMFGQSTFNEYAKDMISAYRESFSDLQMVLLTGISYEEYLKGFIEQENIDLDALESRIADLSRISMVAFVLHYIGVWDIDASSCFFKQYTPIYQFHMIILKQFFALTENVDVEQLKQIFCKSMCLYKKYSVDADRISILYNNFYEELKNTNGIFNLINIPLVRYLAQCAEKSIRHYSSQENEDAIVKLRSIITSVCDFEDVEQTFCVVCNELASYKKEIFNIKET